MLVTVNVVLTTPVVRGLNVMVKGTLCPAGIVTGSDSPPMLNTELLVIATVTVTLPPVAVKFPCAEPLVPTTTLPSPRIVGVILSCPTAPVPVPESGMVRVGFDAFEVMVRLPLALVAVAGA